MDVRPGYRRTDVGVIPEDWREARIGAVADIRVGRDLHEDRFSRDNDSIYRFPVYSNTVAEHGLYGFYSIPEYEGNSVTVVGRGVGLGTAFARTGAYGAIGRLLVLLPSDRVDARFLATYINQRVSIFVETGGIPQLTGLQFSRYKVAVPPLPEQHAIAAALSDVDALLGALDRLIAKKRDLKQAAVQQLLIGQTRLPGFHGGWEVRRLGEVTSLSKGTQLRSSELDQSGVFAHLNGGITASGYTNKANTPADTIAISEGGNSCGFVQFMRKPYWCGGHCYSVIPDEIDNRFLYHALKGQQSAIMALRVGSGLPNVQKSALLDFEVNYPVDPNEQRAVAAALGEMDGELEKLEERRDKTRAVKQAMMQELLTGNTRLT